MDPRSETINNDWGWKRVYHEEFNYRNAMQGVIIEMVRRGPNAVRCFAPLKNKNNAMSNLVVMLYASILPNINSPVVDEEQLIHN